MGYSKLVGFVEVKCMEQGMSGLAIALRVAQLWVDER